MKYHLNLTGLNDSLKKFQEHSALRQKMFEVAGLEFGKRRIPPEVQEYIRSAMINCMQCNNEQECTAWLEAVEQGSSPPEFCQLRTTIAQMRAFANRDEPY